MTSEGTPTTSPVPGENTLPEWQLAHILQGLREADTGEFVSAAEVRRTLRRLRRK